MTDLTAYPIGYQHEPQDDAHLAIEEFAGILCRIVLISSDPNAGFLDGGIRAVSAIPSIGDRISMTGQMMSETITVHVLDVTKQHESYVETKGGPAYILHCMTV